VCRGSSVGRECVYSRARDFAFWALQTLVQDSPALYCTVLYSLSVVNSPVLQDPYITSWLTSNLKASSRPFVGRGIARNRHDDTTTRQHNERTPSTPMLGSRGKKWTEHLQKEGDDGACGAAKGENPYHGCHKEGDLNDKGDISMFCKPTIQVQFRGPRGSHSLHLAL
jgi:hypothetical protein